MCCVLLRLFCVSLCICYVLLSAVHKFILRGVAILNVMCYLCFVDVCV